MYDYYLLDEPVLVRIFYQKHDWKLLTITAMELGITNVAGPSSPIIVDSDVPI